MCFRSVIVIHGLHQLVGQGGVIRDAVGAVPKGGDGCWRHGKG